MDNRNIFEGCFNLIRSYDNVYEFKNDNFYGAHYEEHENQEINLNDPAIQEKWKAHFRSYILEVFTSTYEHLITVFGNLIISKKKIEFLEESYEIIEELQELTEKQQSKDEFIELVKSNMSSLYSKIHKKFDNDLVILKQPKRELKDTEKLQFNMTRTELTHFLLLLKDGDIIDKTISDYALAKFSENYFFCIRNNDPRIPLKSIDKYIDKIRSEDQITETAITKIKERIKSVNDTFLRVNIKTNLL
ncbi:MAG: hypothetical protein JXR56_01255 [Candidatus Cloacimonetes bacterium]|nr:hypothetical protein [Candidatus Cloacimonadota bacterium]